MVKLVGTAQYLTL